MKLQNLPALFFAFLFSSLSIYAQKTEFWGLTSSGGEYDFGAIYKTNSKAEDFKTERSFFRYVGGSPSGTLMRAKNGLFYGVARQYGANKTGVIFEFNPKTEAYRAVYEFGTGADGKQPIGKLAEGANNQLYGVAGGGNKSDGILYTYNYVTDSFKVLHDFDNQVDGSVLEGSAFLASNGNLYGMTLTGVKSKKGVVYEYDLSTDSLHVLVQFDGTNGGVSRCSFIEPYNGILLGLSTTGGKNNTGLIFEYNLNNQTFTILSEFDDSTNGKYPFGELLLASDGKFYGISSAGGNHNQGTLFEFDYSRDKITALFHFTKTDAEYPIGSLIEVDSVLYGLGQYGGIKQDGTLFKYDLQTSSFKVLAEFDDETTGRVPQGDLLHYNGVLYGLAVAGAQAQGQGSMFKYHMLNDTLTKILDFNGGPQGRNPFGDLCFDSTNQVFYGTANYGANTYGCIYKYDPIRKTHENIHDFTGGPGGSYPSGYLVLAPNGKLYGTTKSGGDNYRGTFYEYDLAKKRFSVKASFAINTTGTDANRLMISKTGELLGVARQGGPGPLDGVVFQYDYNNDSLFARAYFDYYTSGSYDYYGMTESPDGYFYGVTDQGGENQGKGTLYRFDPKNDTIYAVYTFHLTDKVGFRPNSGLVINSNGKMYGTTSQGGDYSYGVLFEYDLALDSIRDLYHFKSNSYLKSKPMIYNDKLYFTTNSGGDYDLGVLMEFDLKTDSLTIKKHFSQNDGATPQYTQLLKTNICYHSFSSQKITQCNGSIVSPSGKYTWTQSGTYYDTIPNAVSCDSIITFKITINQSSNYEYSASDCKPIKSPSGKFIWKNSGIYYDTLINKSGCDSIIKANITISPIPKTNIDTLVCKSFKSPSGRYVWNSKGVYLDTLKTNTGCDSILQIDLDLMQYAEPIYIDTTVCDSLISFSNKNIWITSGNYTDTVINTNTCNDIYKVSLTVNKHSKSSITVNGAVDYQLPSGKWVNKSGIYLDTIPNKMGCDSIITVDVTLSVKGSIPKQKAHLYPNPTNGIITIETNLNNYKIEVYNELGKLNSKQENLSGDHTIEIEKSGVYWIIISNNNEQLVEKLIVTKK